MEKIVLIVLLLTGCWQSAPDVKDYVTVDCYVFADCMYRNQSNPDKSVCTIMSDACRDSLKEWRTYKRIEYCRQNKFEGISENECRLLLNQK